MLDVLRQRQSPLGTRPCGVRAAGVGARSALPLTVGLCALSCGADRLVSLDRPTRGRDGVVPWVGASFVPHLPWSCSGSPPPSVFHVFVVLTPSVAACCDSSPCTKS